MISVARTMVSCNMTAGENELTSYGRNWKVWCRLAAINVVAPQPVQN